MEEEKIAVDLQQLKEILKHYYKAKKPAFIWSSRDVKETVREVAQKLNLEIKIIAFEIDNLNTDKKCFIDTALHPKDIIGLPALTSDGIKWIKPEWLPHKGKGILLLNRIDLAPPSMQRLIFQQILHGNLLPEDWIAFCTGNPNSKSEIASPFLDRIAHIWVK